MSLQNDQYYIYRAMEGDSQAFAVLIDRYKYMVYTLAVRIIKNKEEAEEVAQDVFLNIYKNISSFKGDSKFSTWVYRIAYNRSLDYVKKLSRSLETSEIDTHTERHVQLVENTLDCLEREERRDTIKGAIKELSGDDSVLITLYYYEELSLNEIATIMEQSANTIKVRLFRARKRLAQILTERLEPETIRSYGRK
ncbi:MAG: sigma-70 family RNA polymerase sigma factor [Bacteroidota bacterium]